MGYTYAVKKSDAPVLFCFSLFLNVTREDLSSLRGSRCASIGQCCLELLPPAPLLPQAFWVFCEALWAQGYHLPINHFWFSYKT